MAMTACEKAFKQHLMETGLHTVEKYKWGEAYPLFNAGWLTATKRAAEIARTMLIDNDDCPVIEDVIKEIEEGGA